MKAMRIVMERRGGIVAPVAMPRTQTIIPRSEPTRSRAVQNDVERRPQSFQPAFMINRRIQFNVSIFALKSLPFRSGIDGCLRASPSNSSPASLFLDSGWAPSGAFYGLPPHIRRDCAGVTLTNLARVSLLGAFSCPWSCHWSIDPHHQ